MMEASSSGKISSELMVHFLRNTGSIKNEREASPQRNNQVHACRNRKTVLYIRLPELFSKFEEMRIQGKYNEYLNKLGKYDLVILDEFLLKPTNETERSDLLELMEKRCNKKSTIFCSQYSFDGWHQSLDGGPIADAILDRIDNSSYMITLHGKSLRETYSKLNRSK